MFVSFYVLNRCKISGNKVFCQVKKFYVKLFIYLIYKYLAMGGVNKVLQYSQKFYAHVQSADNVVKLIVYYWGAQFDVPAIRYHKAPLRGYKVDSELPRLKPKFGHEYAPPGP